MNKNYFPKLWLNIALFVFIPTVAFAMTSTNFQILWDSINSGGLDVSTSTNFLLRDTIGEHGTGLSSSENYIISAGYRVGDTQPPYLAMNIGTQENDTRIGWTAFSSGGNTVTVTSTSGYSVDDYVGVIENEGFAQYIAFGKITNIAGNDITVDDWEGEPGSISASPSGGDDYMYRMNGNTASLGLILPGLERTSMTLTDVVTNANNGYTMSIQGTDYLASGAGSIIDVSDGEVTLNEEEYGTETVGSLGVGTSTDLAIPTSTQRTIQSSSSYGYNDRVGIIYKLSIDDSTPTGNYTQTVLYRLTGNF